MPTTAPTGQHNADFSAILYGIALSDFDAMAKASFMSVVIQLAASNENLIAHLCRWPQMQALIVDHTEPQFARRLQSQSADLPAVTFQFLSSLM